MEADVMGGTMRILQLGELRLDEMLEGEFANFPAHVQTQILGAKYLAAEILFAAAITEQVELVILTGTPNQTMGGRRPYWFLKRKFEQLKKHGIKVVCAETTDYFSWPEEIHLPDNVHILTRCQSIGFRLAAELQPIEIEWETPQSPAADATGQGVGLRLIETGGKVVAISYAANETEPPVLAEVHAIQAQSVYESGPFQGTLVELDSNDGIELRAVRSEVVGWERIELQLKVRDSLSVLQQKIEEQILHLESHQQQARTTLVTVVLQVSAAHETGISIEARRSLLEEVQRNLNNRNSSAWLCRIEQTVVGSNQLASQSPVIQVAFEQLLEIQQADVYDNLDLHVLEIEPNSFERTRSSVALRLPKLLDEKSVQHRHLASLS